MLEIPRGDAQQPASVSHPHGRTSLFTLCGRADGRTLDRHGKVPTQLVDGRQGAQRLAQGGELGRPAAEKVTEALARTEHPDDARRPRRVGENGTEGIRMLLMQPHEQPQRAIRVGGSSECFEVLGDDAESIAGGAQLGEPEAGELGQRRR